MHEVLEEEQWPVDAAEFSARWESVAWPQKLKRKQEGLATHPAPRTRTPSPALPHPAGTQEPPRVWCARHRARIARRGVQAVSKQ